WSLVGGPVWRHDRANLVTAEIVIESPDGLSRVEFLPIFSHTWQETGLLGFGVGDNYLGSTVYPPVTDALQFLEELVLPAYRAGLVYNVISREPLPDAAQLIAQSIPGSFALVERIRLEYPFDDIALHEEFTVALQYIPNPFIAGATNWSAHTLVAIQAPATEFESTRPMLQAVGQSLQLEAEWFSQYQYVLGLAQQNGLDAIRAAGEESRIIAEANEDISAIHRQAYEETQATNDRLATEFNQLVRGVDTYGDPFGGGSLELPSNFASVHGSDSGTVILTDDPGFDPRDFFPNLNWAELQPD
ncbi:MAG: hypothetical protein GY720_03350, partial [bacterium]|nr:hypothetical protein [bacterium]